MNRIMGEGGHSMGKVNSFEAKTRLSELLRETERGREFIICRRGKEVARLVPRGKLREKRGSRPFPKNSEKFVKKLPNPST
jgi:prevent-host-death family protein